MSDGDLTPRPLKVHKQRQYNTTARTHRYNHENRGVRSSASAFRNAEERRVVSASDILPKHATAVFHESAHTLRPQPSLKHRLLNRMMSGLSSRAQVNGIDERDGNTQQTIHNSRSRCDAFRNNSTSSHTDSNGLTDLEKTLTEFPTPPTSHAGTPKTDRSSESVQSPSQIYRDLCVPLKLAALAA